ncbi:hypothetical protein [Phenylobacterium sp.]|uniref:hypothetical protein n=1 Tax=Phenylobacterium sp. TaxID=1871053 RepID=UPI00289D3B18|nr:hypothetical protein [Phenylobacterium sp.]
MIIRDFAERCHRGLGELGLTLATHDEIIEGRALAARTVSPNIATVETLARLQDLTRSSSFTFRGVDGRLAGVMAIIPLTAAALPDLAAGIFDGVNPPQDQAARPGETVVAIYGWGMAGTTLRGRATVMAGAVRLHRELFPTIPLYGRAATPGGERTLLKRIGAHPVPGPGGLVVADAWAGARKAA